MSYTAKVFDLSDYATLCKDYATLDAMSETVYAVYNMELYNLTDEESKKIYGTLFELRREIDIIREKMFKEMYEMEGKK